NGRWIHPAECLDAHDGAPRLPDGTLVLPIECELRDVAELVALPVRTGFRRSPKETCADVTGQQHHAEHGCKRLGAVLTEVANAIESVLAGIAGDRYRPGDAVPEPAALEVDGSFD